MQRRRLTYYGFENTPAGFIPSQDKGYLLVNVQLPDCDFRCEHTQDCGDMDRGRSPAKIWKAVRSQSTVGNFGPIALLDVQRQTSDRYS